MYWVDIYIDLLQKRVLMATERGRKGRIKETDNDTSQKTKKNNDSKGYTNNDRKKCP